jgi:hypothetical protein
VAVGRQIVQGPIYLPEGSCAVPPVLRPSAGERLIYRYTNEEDGKTLRRYWTTACQTCAAFSHMG